MLKFKSWMDSTSGSVMPSCQLDADLPQLPCGHMGVPTRDIAIQGKEFFH